MAHEMTLAIATAATERVHVAWGEGWLAYSSHDDDGDASVVLDFERRARTIVTAAAPDSYATFPLHEHCSARVIEAVNQRHICQVLAAGGKPDNPFVAPLVEHELAVMLRGSKTSLHEKRGVLARLFGAGTREDTIVIESGGDVSRGACGGVALWAQSADGHADAAAALAFVHVVRDRIGGHPLLLRRIATAGIVPRSLTLQHLSPLREGGDVTITVERAPAPLDEEAAALRRDVAAGRRRSTGLGHSAADHVDALLDDDLWRARVEALGAGTAAERLDAARAAMAGGEALRGLLIFLELTLEDVLPMPADLAETVNREKANDAALQKLLVAFQPHRTKDAARAALEGLAEVREAAGDKAYVLGAFAAPLHRACGEPDAAIRALADVVAHNPRFTGAYKDLGDLFLQSFDARRAWLCWRRARSIAPQLELLKDIAAFEKSLERDHPEYFAFALPPA